MRILGNLFSNLKLNKYLVFDSARGLHSTRCPVILNPRPSKTRTFRVPIESHVTRTSSGSSNTTDATKSQRTATPKLPVQSTSSPNLPPSSANSSQGFVDDGPNILPVALITTNTPNAASSVKILVIPINLFRGDEKQLKSTFDYFQAIKENAGLIQTFSESLTPASNSNDAGHNSSGSPTARDTTKALPPPKNDTPILSKQAATQNSAPPFEQPYWMKFDETTDNISHDDALALYKSLDRAMYQDNEVKLLDTPNSFDTIKWDQSKRKLLAFVPEHVQDKLQKMAISSMQLAFEMNMTNIRDAIMMEKRICDPKSFTPPKPALQDPILSLTTCVESNPPPNHHTIPLNFNALIQGTIHIDTSKMSMDRLINLQVPEFNDDMTTLAANICSTALQRGFPTENNRMYSTNSGSSVTVRNSSADFSPNSFFQDYQACMFKRDSSMHSDSNRFSMSLHGLMSCNAYAKALAEAAKRRKALDKAKKSKKMATKSRRPKCIKTKAAKSKSSVGLCGKSKKKASACKKAKSPCGGSKKPSPCQKKKKQSPCGGSKKNSGDPCKSIKQNDPCKSKSKKDKCQKPKKSCAAERPSRSRSKCGAAKRGQSKCQARSGSKSKCAAKKSASKSKCGSRSASKSKCAAKKSASKSKCRSRSASKSKCGSRSASKSKCAAKKSASKSKCRSRSASKSKCGSRSALKSKCAKKSASKSKCRSRSASKSKCGSRSASKSKCAAKKSASKSKCRSRSASKSKCGSRSASKSKCAAKSASKSKCRSRSASKSKCGSRSASKSKCAKKSASKSKCRSRSASKSKCGSRSASKSKCAAKSASKSKCRSRSASKSKCGSRSASKSKCAAKSASKSKCRSRSASKSKCGSRSASKSKCAKKSASKSKCRSRSASKSKCGSRSASKSKCAAKKSASKSKCRSRSASKSKCGSRSASKSKCAQKSASKSKCRSRSASKSKCGSRSASKSKCAAKSASKTKCRSRSASKSKCGSRSASKSKCAAKSASKSKCRSRSTSKSKCGSRSASKSKCQSRSSSKSGSQKTLQPAPKCRMIYNSKFFAIGLDKGKCQSESKTKCRSRSASKSKTKCRSRSASQSKSKCKKRSASKTKCASRKQKSKSKCTPTTSRTSKCTSASAPKSRCQGRRSMSLSTYRSRSTSQLDAELKGRMKRSQSVPCMKSVSTTSLLNDFDQFIPQHRHMTTPAKFMIRGAFRTTPIGSYRFYSSKKGKKKGGSGASKGNCTILQAPKKKRWDVKYKRRTNCFPEDECPKKLCKDLSKTACGRKRKHKYKKCGTGVGKGVCPNPRQQPNTKKDNACDKNNDNRENEYSIRQYQYQPGPISASPKIHPYRPQIRAFSTSSLPDKECSDNLMNEKVQIVDCCTVKKVTEIVPIFSDYDVLVRTETVALSSSDVHVYETGGKSCPQMTLGHDAAGVIEKVGRCVQHLKTGDRVALEAALSCGICEYCKRGQYNMCCHLYYNGFLSKYQIHPADLCHKLPKQMSLDEGALVQTLALGCQACLQASITPTTNVLVIGSCPTAVSAALCARAFGAHTICICDRMEDTIRFINKAFNFSTISYGGFDDLNNTLECIAFEMNTWPDVVINCSVSELTMNLCVMALQPCGTCILAGCETECACFNAIDVLMKNLRIISSFRSTNMFPTALHLIKAGYAPMGKFISRAFNWDGVEKAFRAAQHEANVGNRKVLIRCATEDSS